MKFVLLCDQKRAEGGCQGPREHLVTHRQQERGAGQSPRGWRQGHPAAAGLVDVDDRAVGGTLSAAAWTTSRQPDPGATALPSAGADVLRADPCGQPDPDGRGPVRRAGHRGRYHRGGHRAGRGGARAVGGAGREGRLRRRTSGRSSRLVHGGLRYLEHGDFGLVRESLRERGILYRLAPHLVRPVPMYMLAGDLRRRATYRAGLTAYEVLAAGRNIGYHTSVRAGRVAEAIPGLGEPSRGFRYFECQTDDARLTIEVARAAHAAGARLANHARVTGLLGERRVTGAAVTDEMTGQGFEARARNVVNATDIWAERVAELAAGSGVQGRVRLRPSKGVHLVFAPGAVRTTAAVVAPSAAHDGRYVFIVPWEDRVYAGTTDTPYQGDLDDP